MAATATASSVGPRYAPEDPTLPKPWRGLVDGKTGYLYFWNPETNVTQYERPSGESNKSSAPQQKLSSISSSVQVHQSSQGQRRDSGSMDDHDRYNRDSNGASKPTSDIRNYQSAKGGPDYISNGTIAAAGQGGSSVRGHVSSGGSGLSPDAYRKKHEISVTGDNVPPPFTSFEETGFPSELLREAFRITHHPGGLLLVMIQFAAWSNGRRGLFFSLHQHRLFWGVCLYLERSYTVDQF